MIIERETTVAEIATRFPQSIRIFERHRIDFCCGGKRPLAEVCGTAAAFDRLRAELESSCGPEGALRPAWQGGDLRTLVAHILRTYHRPLDEELPRLSKMMDKVLAVHGERHRRLADLAATVG